jgi:alkyl sulfatase BDS1-like metallo-beta-lactamase superfamily hydrolase
LHPKKEDNMKRQRFIVALILITIAMVSGQFAETADGSDESGGKKLAAYTEKEFQKGIVKVTDGVWVVIGYGAGQPILIEGTDGVIIVDCGEGLQAAQAAKVEFDKITTKPLKAIIYTHSHRDHVSGAKVFMGEGKVDIYARDIFSSDLMGDEAKLAKAIGARTKRQFGIGLPPAERISIGLGPGDRMMGGLGAGYIPPNKTFSGDRTEIEISGVKMELVAAQGETDDHLFVWLPQKRVLLPGDNFYATFPNLYAIRGTAYRDVSKWANSIDKMLQYPAEYLVPGHTRPVTGAENVRQTLSDYRDAIRFVLAKTIEGMNKGLTPDELVDYVKLPENLAGKPYLQEHYGTVAWSVRAVYAGLMGWFDGNPTNLFPLSPAERATRIAGLAGGKESLLTKAKAALSARDCQWACELLDALITLDPKSAEPKLLKADALRALAEGQTSANARNYYFSAAKELREEVDPSPPRAQ